MNIRTASLSFAFIFATLPAFAQGPPGAQGGVIQALTNQLAALSARVDKLEGNIVAGDLVGSYTLSIIDIPMSGGVLGVRPATISTDAAMATVTLHLDGSASFDLITCGGSRLIQGSWALIVDPDACSDPPPSDPHWTYADGILTLFFDAEEKEGFPLSLAAGGRFGIVVGAPFHPQDPSSDEILVILSRLK